MRAAAITLALLLLAPVAEGSGIFISTTSDASRQGAVAASKPDRARSVRVALHRLEAARDEALRSDAGRLVLNLPDGPRLQGVVTATASTAGGYSLAGRIDERDGGFVTLAVRGQSVAGSIWTPHSSFEIVPLGGGRHAVQPAPSHRCMGARKRDLAQEAPVARSAGSAPDDDTVVDVLVVWTPEREDDAGGEEQVRAEIDHWIAYTNAALERSGAFVTLNLAGAERVDYVESSDGVTDLNRLTDMSDGHMDEVHDRRDALAADLVNLYVLKSAGYAVLDSPFTIANHYTTFAHEIGHSFGIGHDRYVWYEDGSDVGRVTMDRVRCNPTIMAYGRQCRDAGLRDQLVPYYASPWRYDRFGVARGVWRFSSNRTTGGPADAVATLNRARHAVASWR